MTEYHNYNTPSKGESDWHIPLNENFKQIDQDVEVRDLTENRGQYQPKAGAKFLSTDTGHVYMGDGDKWNITSIGKFPLNDGFVVAQGNGHEVIVDPRDYSSDADAIQAANDGLVEAVANSSEVGVVWIPALRPDGTELTISKTVTFGSPTEAVSIIPRGCGFHGQSGPTIQCTIDNGDPMFHVVGDLANGYATKLHAEKIGGWAARANGNDAEMLRLSNITTFHLEGTLARDFNTTTAAGVYVFDGRCFNSYINNTAFIAVGTPCPDTDVWVMRNDTGDGDPGELKFGPANSTFSHPSFDGFNTGYRCEVNSSAMVWGGRIEGAGGEAAIYQTKGYLTITDYAELDILYGNQTDKVYFDGYMLRVSPGVDIRSNKTGGHGIHIGSMARGYIPSLPNDNIDGDVIHIENDGGSSNYIVVPYENTFNGTVSYPSAPWGQLVYPDGWQKFRQGTTRIEGGSTTELTQWAGSDGTEIRLTNLSIASDPNADCRYQPVRGWKESTNANGRQWVGIEEKNNVSFDLSWELHRRP